MGEIVGDNYLLQQKIGQGSFGKIYIASHVNTGKKYAVKMEDSQSRVPQLIFEARLYNIMSGSCNVPRIYHHCTDLNYNIIVVDLLGRSLEDLLNRCHRRMSVKTVLMLADQMISAVEFFHSKNYIHRDIKPDNFVMGTAKNSNQLYIIDYGLAKKYRDHNTHQHIPYVEGKSLTGTARYASINALAGCEQSRRDDMEALGYVWVYLLRGGLPWMGINAADKINRYEKICQYKQNTPVHILCKDLPREFEYYFKLVRGLDFEQVPDYAGYRKMFRDLICNLGYIYDYKYDWTDGGSLNHVHLPPTRYIGRKQDRKNEEGNQDSIEKVNSLEALKSGENNGIFAKKPVWVNDVNNDNFSGEALATHNEPLVRDLKETFVNTTRAFNANDNPEIVPRRKARLSRRKSKKTMDEKTYKHPDAKPAEDTNCKEEDTIRYRSKESTNINEKQRPNPRALRHAKPADITNRFHRTGVRDSMPEMKVLYDELQGGGIYPDRNRSQERIIGHHNAPKLVSRGYLEKVPRAVDVKGLHSQPNGGYTPKVERHHSTDVIQPKHQNFNSTNTLRQRPNERNGNNVDNFGVDKSEVRNRSVETPLPVRYQAPSKNEEKKKRKRTKKKSSNQSQQHSTHISDIPKRTDTSEVISPLKRIRESLPDIKLSGLRMNAVEDFLMRRGAISRDAAITKNEQPPGRS